MRENNLHAYLIERIRDYDQVIAELERFLPWVDNWATCDTMSPRRVQAETHPAAPSMPDLDGDAHPYTVRFGMGMLMRYFLDDAFDPSDLELVASLRSEEYYVKMMAAWYFATALAKQYKAALPIWRTGGWMPGPTTRPSRRPWRAAASPGTEGVSPGTEGEMNGN